MTIDEPATDHHELSLSAVTFLKLNLSKHVPVNIRNSFLVLCPNAQVLYIGHYDIVSVAWNKYLSY